MWHYFFVRGFLLQSPCRLLPLLLLLFLLLLAPLASDAFSFTDRAARCNHHVKFYASSNALQECAGKRRAPPFVGGAVGAVDRLVFRHPGDGGVSALASAGVGESAALPEDARESRGEEDGLLSLEEARALLPAPPTGLGARRRADKEANWFKTYLYGPIDPRRGMRADSAAQKETQQQQVQSTLEALRLAETKRPPGLRWKLLEDLRVGTQVLRAAEAAAQRTAERIAASATVCAAPKKKRRLSKAVPTHVVLRRAALRAAAEAVEKNLLEEEEAARREAERGSPLDLLSGGGAESSSSFPDSSLQQPGSARRVYAQALRSLLSRRREERASEEGQKSLSFAATPPAALGGGGEESSSASGAPSEERFVSLLDALTPREGTMLSYSAALLAAQLTASAGFDETVEVHVQMRRGKAASGSSAPRLQGFVTLPHGVVPGGGLTEAGGPQAQLGGAAAAAEDKDSPPAFPAASIRGKKKGGLWRRRRGIAVLVNDDEQREQARAAGADWVGVDEVGAQLSENPFAVDVLISTPEALASLGKHWKVVGSKKLMPSPALGTLTGDPIAAIRLYRQPTVQFVCDKFNVVHAPIGYVSLGPTRLLANFRAFFAALKAAALEARRASASPSVKLKNPPFHRLVQSVHVCATMGPGMRIDPRSL